MVKVMKKSSNLWEGAGKTNCGSWAVRKAGASCKGLLKERKGVVLLRTFSLNRVLGEDSSREVEDRFEGDCCLFSKGC